MFFARDEDERDEVGNLLKLLSRKMVTIAFLYRAVKRYYDTNLINDPISFSAFIANEVEGYRVAKSDLIPASSREHRKHALLSVIDPSKSMLPAFGTNSTNKRKSKRKPLWNSKKVRRTLGDDWKEFSENFGVEETPDDHTQDKMTKTMTEKMNMSFLFD